MTDQTIVLAGDLVILTNPEDSHASFFYELASDEQLRYYSSDEPFRKPQPEEFIYYYLTRLMPATRYYLPFVILDKDTGQPVGQIHAGRIDHDNQNCMIGFEIHPRSQQRGYGTDAVETLLDHLFFDMKLHRVGAEVYEYNQASRKVLKKLGFSREGRLTEWLYRKGKYWDKLLYGILRNEWINSTDDE
ncbi:MAG: N-acetyltransferase GCN5 [Marinimicrobia bacterium 46_47]|nr:MAG: N-acetyltransferase GCN5 [Marinimicrobia bacterium 46_47]KUK93780.1 MAG: N-acetyltransferase GCN5 [Marinimicrobia bacterium 46_43]